MSPNNEFRRFVAVFVAIVFGLALGFVLVIHYVNHQDHSCRERGGVPYRSICLNPESLR